MHLNLYKIVQAHPWTADSKSSVPNNTHKPTVSLLALGYVVLFTTYPIVPMQGCEDTDPYTCPPRPPYLQSNTSLRRPPSYDGGYEGEVEGREEEALDTCYHLLQLYSGGGHSLEKVLSPESSTSDHMDYRLR